MRIEEYKTCEDNECVFYNEYQLIRMNISWIALFRYYCQSIRPDGIIVKKLAARQH